MANEDTLLQTHCCRHKCFPVCPRAQHLLTQKMFLILPRNILCPQQMLPSFQCVLVYQGLRPGLNPRLDWLSILPQKVSIYEQASLEEKRIFVPATIGKCKRKNSHAFTTECLWLRSTFEFKVIFNLYEAFSLAERPTDGGLPGLYRCTQQTTIMKS